MVGRVALSSSVLQWISKSEQGLEKKREVGGEREREGGRKENKAKRYILSGRGHVKVCVLGNATLNCCFNTGNRVCLLPLSLTLFNYKIPVGPPS